MSNEILSDSQALQGGRMPKLKNTHSLSICHVGTHAVAHEVSKITLEFQPFLRKPATCETRPRAQASLTRKTLQYMFPFHPSSARRSKRPHACTSQRELCPLCIAPETDTPQPSAGWTSRNVSCPSPLVQSKSVRPFSHTCLCGKTTGTSSGTTDPVDVIFISMPLLGADAPEHRVPSHPQLPELFVPRRPTTTAPQHTTSNRDVKELQPAAQRSTLIQ